MDASVCSSVVSLNSNSRILLQNIQNLAQSERCTNGIHNTVILKRSQDVLNNNSYVFAHSDIGSMYSLYTCTCTNVHVEKTRIIVLAHVKTKNKKRVSKLLK